VIRLLVQVTGTAGVLDRLTLVLLVNWSHAGAIPEGPGFNATLHRATPTPGW
jgi:hypothetical protein